MDIVLTKKYKENNLILGFAFFLTLKEYPTIVKRYILKIEKLGYQYIIQLIFNIMCSISKKYFVKIFTINILQNEFIQ